MPDAVVLTTSASGQTGVTSGSSLVTQVSRPVGGEGEAEIRAQALDCINRVRVELNQLDFRFMKTTDDPITLVDGTATYSLERTFRKPSFAVLIDSAAVVRGDVRYIDDETFAHQNSDMSSTGLPQWYMLRNDFEDGLITLYPTPDNSAAADYRLVVEYYARIEALSDTTDEVDLPEEATNALVVGGQYYILNERDKGSPAAMRAFGDFQRLVKLLLTDDRRVNDEKPRFRLSTARTVPVGSVLIRA